MYKLEGWARELHLCGEMFLGGLKEDGDVPRGIELLHSDSSKEPNIRTSDLWAYNSKIRITVEILGEDDELPIEKGCS